MARPKIEKLLRADKREFIADIDDALGLGAEWMLCIYELKGRLKITSTSLDSRHRIAGALADLQHWVLIDAESPDEDEKEGS